MVREVVSWLYTGICSKCKRSHAIEVTAENDVKPLPIIGAVCPCAAEANVTMTRRGLA